MLQFKLIIFIVNATSLVALTMKIISLNCNIQCDVDGKAAVPTPSSCVVENILHPGFIRIPVERVFSQRPYSAIASCENE